jgi:spore germination cell wall hydrolase CwlJ-like protein
MGGYARRGTPSIKALKRAMKPTVQPQVENDLMFKTIRAAGIAAAAAFLCSGYSAAAATQDQVNPAAPAAATDTPVETAAPAAPIVDYVTADTALTPGRARPDRAAEPAPIAAPVRTERSGVTAAAGQRRSLNDLVAEHAGAELDDEQFQCLASAVYFESRGEPLDGQLAVAEVILNRVASGRFRSTICDVVKQPSQFSFVRRGVIPQPKRETAAWDRAVAIAHIALNELADVTGENSLFFHATYVNPGWGRPRVAKIGNHIFYR